jgi:SAM-dependent methyltransferase
MSFSADWLALREPADHVSVNPEVRAALTARFEKKDHITVVDLGCGAGSNLRGTWSALPRWQNWTLVDYDQKLLDAARQRLTQWAGRVNVTGDKLVLMKGDAHITVSFRKADLSTGDFADVVKGADLVTASALFDLVSVPVIEKLATTMHAQGQTFSTVLTYDGHARWEPPHPADATMRDAFNAHQRGNKGFGPAAGPGGTSALAKAFYGRGYRVLRGTSPWIVDKNFPQLRADLDSGFAGAVSETGKFDPALVENWLKLRQASADGVTVIGHEDLLAFPADK